MKLDYLIFDLDGTLSDPALGIIRCMNFALTSYDYAPRSEQEITSYIGPPLEVALSELSGSTDESHLKELISKYRERYGEFGYAENELYPNIRELLKSLQNQGFRMGVCTSKLTIMAEKILDRFALGEYFDFVDGGDFGITKAMQLEKLTATKIVKTNSIMIGDRHVDIAAAKHNGLLSMGVLWGFGSEEELSEAAPDYIIGTTEQLLQIVKN